MINKGANIAVPYASREIRKPNIEPVPVVKTILHVKAKIPAGLENFFTFRSNIVQIYIAKIPANPEYKKMFHAKIDLKLYVVIATIRRSGLPRSRTKIASPAIKKAIANRADSGARGLYNFLSNTDDIDAIFSTPEAITIKSTANMWGRPQTI